MKRPLVWFLILLLLSIASVLIDAHTHQQVHAVQKRQIPPVQPPIVERVKSMIPNFRISAVRFFVQKVDLRRAELLVRVDEDETYAATLLKPVTDKVLVAPKSFA